ncbi:MAG TPA: hypothetical protein VKU00_04255 [Chthonomonadaceae bacterium]|nr:hypothetical protein [Chthonomonadaceae bacterium]
MYHVRMLRWLVVKNIFSTVFMTVSILCILVMAACRADNKSQPPAQVDLPSDWSLWWYQWQAPDRLLLQYDLHENIDYYVKFNTKTRSTTEITTSQNTNRMLFNYGSPTWQISPDRAWLIGYVSSGQRLAMELNSSKWVVGTTFAPWARWMPDSRGWLEWQWDDNTVIRLFHLSDDEASIKPQGAEYTIQGQWTVVGFISSDKILVHGMSEDGKDWVARIVALHRDAKVIMEWRLRIPNLHSVLGAAISPDLKRVCWLTLCKHFPHASRHPSEELSDASVTLDKNIWISTTDGKDQRLVYSMELPISFISYMANSGGLGIPSENDIEWVPGSKQVSFLQKGRLWTVDIP